LADGVELDSRSEKWSDLSKIGCTPYGSMPSDDVGGLIVI
jgi:hypothetical protein